MGELVSKTWRLVLLCILGFVHSVTAQDSNEMPKSFKTFGFSGFGFLDFQAYNYTKVGFDGSTTVDYEVHTSIYTMTWGKRWNLLELDDHFSVSLETSPMLAFSMSTIASDISYMSLDIPLMLGGQFRFSGYIQISKSNGYFLQCWCRFYDPAFV